METNEEQWTDEEVASYGNLVGWLGVAAGVILTLMLLFTFVWGPNMRDNLTNQKVCDVLGATHLDGFCVKDSMLIYEIP